jgi:hypothetical protein
VRAEVRVLDFVRSLQSADNLLGIGAQFHALIGEFWLHFFAGAFTPQALVSNFGFPQNTLVCVAKV